MQNRLYIGDNLTVMKQLLKDNTKVDCVLTDPPYLTKNNKLTYFDRFTEEEWIEFMKQRFTLAHKLLKDTGCLIVNIDDRMHIELQTLLYNIFGKKNKVLTFIWKKRSSGANQSKFAVVEHEYIIVFAKNIKKYKMNGIPQFTPKTHDNRNFQFDDGKARKNNPDYHHYPIHIYNVHSNGQRISLTPFPGSIEIIPMTGTGEKGCWRAIPKTCQKLIDADMLVVKKSKKDGKYKIYQKQYSNFQFNKKTGKLEPFVRTNPIRSMILEPTNLNSNKEIKEIFGTSAFTYAKPVELIKKLIFVCTQPNDIILDPFAGSGTTGQACWETNRQFILIQLDEGGIPKLIKHRLDKKIGEENYFTFIAGT